MQEKALTETESLHIIHSMINNAKNQFTENGHLYLVWGWVIVVCSVGHFVLMEFYTPRASSIIWTLTFGAVIYQFIYLAKKEKTKKVTTYSEEIIRYVWICFVVMMFLFGWVFGSLMGAAYYLYMYPAFLVLYGMPTILSGAIIRFKPLVFGGIGCWVLSLIATFVTIRYQLLLLAPAVIMAWIIPGYLLRAHYRKNQVS